jgi:hypothetical protein
MWEIKESSCHFPPTMDDFNNKVDMPQVNKPSQVDKGNHLVSMVDTRRNLLNDYVPSSSTRHIQLLNSCSY